MKPLRILMISGSYPHIHCGVGDYTYTLAKELSKICDRITVLTSVDATSDGSDKIEVLNIIKEWRGLQLIRKVTKIVKNGGYDIIHFQYPTTKYVKSVANYLLPMFLRLSGHKVVFTMHEYSDTSVGYKICRIPAILFSNEIVVVDEDFRIELNKQYPSFKNKIHFVNIGSNIPKSQITQQEVEKLRESIITKHKDVNCIISYFGFITPNKCFEAILTAMKELKDESKLNSMLLLIGKINNENKYQAHIKRLVEEYGLNGYVEELGFVPATSVGNYFRCSDGAVILFEKGVSPRNGSFLAAVQEPIPVITTESRQIKQYIKNETNIHLIKNDVEVIKENIVKLQNHEFDQITCHQLFDWKDIANKHIDLYNKI